MTQNNSKTCIRKFILRKRPAVAEVISSLLLVVITVVGALLLTTFLDESFVAGGLTVSSSTDSTIKTIKLRAYDTRNGDVLMDAMYQLNNTGVPNQKFLCRQACGVSDALPANGGSDFLVIQIENRSVNPIFLKNIYLDNVSHFWDVNTSAKSVLSANFPSDGTFSILPVDDIIQNKDNQIQNGQTVNLLIKLDTINPDIELSKTIRVQLNIGANSLAEFLIESGDAV